MVKLKDVVVPGEYLVHQEDDEAQPLLIYLISRRGGLAQVLVAICSNDFRDKFETYTWEVEWAEDWVTPISEHKLRMLVNLYQIGSIGLYEHYKKAK